MYMNRNMIWNLCCVLVVIISLLTFTPLITPSQKYTPELMGMPYTLWTGIIQAIVLVLLTFIGTIIHPGNKTK